jgi:hypothetical protein
MGFMTSAFSGGVLVGLVVGILLFALYLWIVGARGWTWWPYSSYCDNQKPDKTE